MRKTLAFGVGILVALAAGCQPPPAAAPAPVVVVPRAVEYRPPAAVLVPVVPYRPPVEVDLVVPVRVGGGRHHHRHWR